METTNLFDYATKELSQDAFLRWLFENFNDPVVGAASKKLLTEMIKLYHKPPFDVNSITDIKTFAQFKKIDVIVDAFIDNAKVATFIIEDKTESKEHNQLEIYDNFIDTWNDQKYLYRIFYKTQIIDFDERKRINNKWKILDIMQISSIFEEFINSSNLVLKYYAQHVNKIRKELNEIPDINNVEKWNFNQAASFFEKSVMENDVLKKYKKDISYEIGTYLGRYVSLRVYYKIHNKKFLDLKGKNRDFFDLNLCYPVLEFIFRPDRDDIDVYTHITYKFYNDKNERDWTWKNKSDNLSNELYLNFKPAELNNTLKMLLENNGVKCKSMDSDSAQTISSNRIKKVDIVNNDAWASTIVKYLKIFEHLNND